MIWLRTCLATLGLVLIFGCGSKEKKSEEASPTQETSSAPAPTQAPKPVKVSPYDQLIHAAKSGMASETIRRAKDFLAKNEKDARALNVLAMFHMKKKRYGLAKILLGRAFKVEPRSPSLHNNLALIHMSEDQSSKAIRLFRKALALDSGFAPAAANLGTIYVTHGDYAKGRGLLEIATRTYSSDFVLWHNYGLALAQTENFSKAQEAYQKAMDLNNTDSTLLFNYAILLVEKMKDYQKAQTILEKLQFAGMNARQRDRFTALERAVKAGKEASP